MLALYVVFQLFSHTKIQNKIWTQNIQALFSANTYCQFSKAAHIKRLVKILTIGLIQASNFRFWDKFARNRSLGIDVYMFDVIW